MKNVLKPGAIYFADNGRRICAKCAGASARATGRDISGQAIYRVTANDAMAWARDMGEPLTCERRCTTAHA